MNHFHECFRVYARLGMRIKNLIVLYWGNICKQIITKNLQTLNLQLRDLDQLLCSCNWYLTCPPPSTSFRKLNLWTSAFTTISQSEKDGSCTWVVNTVASVCTTYCLSQSVTSLLWKFFSAVDWNVGIELGTHPPASDEATKDYSNSIDHFGITNTFS